MTEPSGYPRSPSYLSMCSRRKRVLKTFRLGGGTHIVVEAYAFLPVFPLDAPLAGTFRWNAHIFEVTHGNPLFVRELLPQAPMSVPRRLDTARWQPPGRPHPQR